MSDETPFSEEAIRIILNELPDDASSDDVAEHILFYMFTSASSATLELGMLIPEPTARELAHITSQGLKSGLAIFAEEREAGRREQIIGKLRELGDKGRNGT